MKDNEIIKALECCGKSSWLFDCAGCPCYDKKEDIQTSECQERIMTNALDLINRQQAEIDELRMENAQLQSDIVNANMNSDHALAEIERLKARNVNNCRNWQTKYNSLRAEAIKEFAERLKYNITLNNTNDGYLDYVVDYNCLIEDINDLVQEMTEGKR